ncbi:hypothetical protein BT69DRAFT_1278271 [Atractiella rhizophila]|nr:hypothetical protein BT69DRAFT_1278271 [Atractiella rhizophila]
MSCDLPSISKPKEIAAQTTILTLPPALFSYIFELLFESYKTYTLASFLRLSTVCKTFKGAIDVVGLSSIILYRPYLVRRFEAFIHQLTLGLDNARIGNIRELMVDLSESEWMGGETTDVVLRLWEGLPCLQRLGAKGFDSQDLRIPKTLALLENVTLNYRFGRNLPVLSYLIPASNHHPNLTHLSLKYVQLSLADLMRLPSLRSLTLDSCIVDSIAGDTSMITSPSNSNEKHDLKSLSISGDFPFSSIDASYSFFMSISSVTRLHWNVTPLPPSRFKEVFSLMPNIANAEFWWGTAMEVTTSGEMYLALPPTIVQLKLCYPPASSLRKALRAGLMKELRQLTILHQRQEEDWEMEMEELCEARGVAYMRLPYRFPWT